MKPENLILASQMNDTDVKIADFGLCCSGGDDSDEGAKTTRGSLERVERVYGGTKGYMAPEQMLARLQRKQRRAEGEIVEHQEEKADRVPGVSKLNRMKQPVSRKGLLQRMHINDAMHHNSLGGAVASVGQGHHGTSHTSLQLPDFRRIVPHSV